MIYFDIFKYIEKYHKNNFGSIILVGNEEIVARIKFRNPKKEEGLASERGSQA